MAILLSAIIGSAILGISAVAFRQIATVDKYTSGTFAFYAAESGIEEGLLRFRFDKNAEIPASITTSSADPLARKPLNVYRNFLAEVPMRLLDSDGGVTGGYTASDRRQIYDLQVYYKQNYTGDDKAPPLGQISGKDLADPIYSADYKIAKDNAETFTILSDPSVVKSNDIYLYWKWVSSSCNSTSRAVEIKAKVVDATGSGDDEYTMLYSNPRCPPLRNATPAILFPGTANVYYPGNELKSAMGISAKTVLSITLKPVGNTADSGDGIYFGFDQGDATKNGRTAGLTSTIDSTGYFAGTSRKITANINRQNGTILDLFQYVIYKGER
ncbi:MAG: Uncharacterized protein Athens101428_417 [Candidatus Berkelbacteria bacterium Athens1014_28]|uniref:Uncharacterized protein n=1 Tax=Candidatus Berkelbacteria bacterium Athens1014_28 TaxID=2017145 RepID=A0A554LMI6_9BACT|nr:MAG: Uncharacterized protein Athens101428_417 [Candidatus Berkelbacteria bacterium Athens1014_28]